MPPGSSRSARCSGSSRTGSRARLRRPRRPGPRARPRLGSRASAGRSTARSRARGAPRRCGRRRARSRRARRRSAVPPLADVTLVEVPAARPHDEGRGLVVQRVALLGRLERDRAPYRVAKVRLALDHVRPGRRARVLEVAHEDARAGVERVDHHLAVGRPGDLAAAVAEIGRGDRDLPAGTGTVRGDEGRPCARVELALALVPAREQLAATRVELAVEAPRSARGPPARGSPRRWRRERRASYRRGDRTAHAASDSNCSSSVEPRSASVEDCAAAHDLGDPVEVAGADLALVARRGVAVVLERELALLQLDVGGHPAARRSRAPARTSPR